MFWHGFRRRRETCITDEKWEMSFWRLLSSVGMIGKAQFNNERNWLFIEPFTLTASPVHCRRALMSSFFVCSCRITAKEPVRFKLSHLQHLCEVVSWKLSLHNICALETGLSRYLKSLVPRLITSFSLHLDIFLLTANHCRWMMDESYSRQVCQL